ncbi:MAG: class I SAM-dependent DNA methyltransferase, partial [Acidobacteria bacterium]|nr:class I SAM-dependent DNA methyltransferase [Acidobacteriota bacterium]
MTPFEFHEKWRLSTLKESSGAQQHFLDLCALLGETTPAQADPDGTWYTFEKGAPKTGGGDGFADVWKRGCFAWEYKGKHKDLHAALAQLEKYAAALENPPLLVVSDMETIRVHTRFTNTVQQIHELSLSDLLSSEKRALLKRIFSDPESLKPGITREALTEEAAETFAGLAQALRERGHAPQRVAHFVNKLLFCLFAEDIGILPTKLLTRLLEASRRRPDRFQDMAGRLFAAMRDGGDFDLEIIDWFNGGLFDDDDALPLLTTDIDVVLKCSKLDWSAIEPSIFGTLFERGLDPDKRSQLGAHYTDRDSIQRIVQPVVVRPLEA